MIRRLYDRTLSLAGSQNALRALAVVAFVEASVFPAPPDVLMIPMIIARPGRAWLIAFVALVGSVLGGLAGYAIGAVFYETVGLPVLEFYGRDADFEDFGARYNEWGAWAVLVAGITPFPFKVITILSGATGLSLPVFVISSIIARGMRFFVVAGLLWKFGAPIRGFIERRLALLFTLFIILLIGGFCLTMYP